MEKSIEERFEDLYRMKRELLIERAARDVNKGIYYCGSCLEAVVFPEHGEDTCPSCLSRI